MCFAGAVLAMVLGLFLSAPVRAEDPAPLFTFVVAADPHAAQNRTNELTGIEKFQKFIGAARSLPRRPDFILLAGDLHPNELQQALAASPSDIPLHVVPGNHETMERRKKLDEMFPADFKGRDFYSFRHKGCLFIGLCTATAYGDHVGHLESEGIRGRDQCDWLRKVMEEGVRNHDRIFVFGHIPPSPEGKSGGGYLASNDQSFLRELILKYSPVELYFGHTHSRREFKIGESQVRILPSLNWNSGNQPAGFLEVMVFQDRIASVFHTLDQRAENNMPASVERNDTKVIP